MNVNKLKSMLNPGVHAHLVGIGGVSMFPLSEMLMRRGLTVTGSDNNIHSPNCEHLLAQGVTVYPGHFPDNVKGADLVIRTAAVHDDNPEIAAAKAAGIPVFERAEALGALMSDYRHALCVAGTHGKTTTTSMCTYIAMAAGTDPSIMIGGNVPLLGSGYRIGQRDTFVLEACEYRDSFLHFRPTVAVVLNVELDHTDYFPDLDAVKRSFRAFAASVPENGFVVVNADDENAMDALHGIDRKTVTFGMAQGDYTARNVEYTLGVARFDLVERGETLCTIQLSVPGAHNVYNALGAAAACRCMGFSPEVIAKGLNQFTGAERRFEYRGECNGAKVYDDYAHHPGELDTLFTTARTLGYNRVVCAFQPHTYTRTEEFFEEFVAQLSRVDKLVMMEIYPAREKNIHNTSSRQIVERIPGSVYCATLKETEQALRAIARPGDLVLTVGAGELNQVAGWLTSTP